MTSPIGEPGRHHAVPDDEVPGEDPIVLDNSRMPPVDDPRDDDLVVLGNDRTSPGDRVPDDEQVVLEGELMRDDDQAAPGDSRIAPEDHLAPDDGQAVRSEDDTAAGMPASGSASAASVSAGAAPAAAVPAGSVDGGPGTESPAATDNADGAGQARQWPDIQAMFVDDPRASVEQAAGLVDDCVEALVVSVKERQHALLSDWQGTGTDTEQLRTALQRYRTFWSSLKDFSPQA
jgi:hypothetical protein